LRKTGNSARGKEGDNVLKTKHREGGGESSLYTDILRK
jgi:hypothetical protein